MSEDLEDRVSALERQVARIAGDTLAAHTMASLADRDVADYRHALRAHTTSLNALRETQLEQGRTLDEHGRVLGALVVEVSGLAGRADETSARVEGVETRLGGVETRLERLEVGQERVETRLERLEVGQERVETRLERLETGQTRTVELLDEILTRLPRPGA